MPSLLLLPLGLGAWNTHIPGNMSACTGQLVPAGGSHLYQELSLSQVSCEQHLTGSVLPSRHGLYLTDGKTKDWGTAAQGHPTDGRVELFCFILKVFLLHMLRYQFWLPPSSQGGCLQGKHLRTAVGSLHLIPGAATVMVHQQQQIQCIHQWGN